MFRSECARVRCAACCRLIHFSGTFGVLAREVDGTNVNVLNQY